MLQYVRFIHRSQLIPESVENHEPEDRLLRTPRVLTHLTKSLHYARRHKNEDESLKIVKQTNKQTIKQASKDRIVSIRKQASKHRIISRTINTAFHFIHEQLLQPHTQALRRTLDHALAHQPHSREIAHERLDPLLSVGELHAELNGRLVGRVYSSRRAFDPTVFPHHAEPNLVPQTRQRDDNELVLVAGRLSVALRLALRRGVLAMLLHEHAQLRPSRSTPIREGTAQGSSSPPGETPPRTRAATARPRRLPAAETSPPADRRPSGASRAAPAAAR